MEVGGELLTPSAREQSVGIGVIRAVTTSGYGAGVDAAGSVADDLATALFALDTGRRTTEAVTRQITREIVGWAIAHGWSPRTEARVHAPPSPAGAPRLGFIDVIVRRGGADADLAIEIDSADKPWSVTKLRHAAAAGLHAIWVRWGDEAWAGVYDDVDVIQLPEMRRSAHRPAVCDQLTLWQ